MTVIIGVLCRDGVIVGADSAATFSTGQMRTIEQQTKKIDIIGNSVIVAGTGDVGLGQRFTQIVREAWDKKEFQRPSHIEMGKELSRRTIVDFGSTHAFFQHSNAGLITGNRYGSILAFSQGGKPYLCEFSPDSFQPEFKTLEQVWYVSMGSGQPIVDPFLALIRDIFWNDGAPSRQDAVFAVTWALTHAIQVNPGGINGPIHLAVLELEKNGNFKARFLETTELEEHKQNVDSVKEYLRKYPNSLKNAVADTPDIPTLQKS